MDDRTVVRQRIRWRFANISGGIFLSSAFLATGNSAIHVSNENGMVTFRRDSRQQIIFEIKMLTKARSAHRKRTAKTFVARELYGLHKTECGFGIPNISPETAGTMGIIK